MMNPVLKIIISCSLVFLFIFTTRAEAATLECLEAKYNFVLVDDYENTDLTWLDLSNGAVLGFTMQNAGQSYLEIIFENVAKPSSFAKKISMILMDDNCKIKSTYTFDPTDDFQVIYPIKHNKQVVSRYSVTTGEPEHKFYLQFKTNKQNKKLLKNNNPIKITNDHMIFD